jgi:hypothetical protein
VTILLSRRQVLAALGAAAVVAATPWTRVAESWAATRGRFFTARERRRLEALGESILPADADPGATGLGVVRYIERLLTAFDYRVPRLYAGGPFSGRRPFIDYACGVPDRRRLVTEARRAGRREGRIPTSCALSSAVLPNAGRMWQRRGRTIGVRE